MYVSDAQSRGDVPYELAPHDVEVVALARKTFAALESIFTDAVSRAVAEGDLPASTHPRELAATLLAVKQGHECLARTGLSKAGLKGIAHKAALELLGGEGRPGAEKETTARERARRARRSHV